MESLSIVVGVSGSVVFLLLLLKLVQRNRTFPEVVEGAGEVWSDEWFEEFSSFRYLPMRRLLCAEDENYFASATSEAGNLRHAFRAERRRLFCEYLGLISSDFGRLSHGLRVAIVHATEDQTPAIQSLLRLEWEFRKLLLQARVRVALHWIGVKPVDATELINALQGFEFGLREVMLQSAA